MTDPQRHDQAVVFCCDRNYYPMALFMLRQIAFHNPFRRFDFVVASRDDLPLPDWARDLGLILHRTGELPAHAEVARFIGTMAPLYRLTLARELGDRYRRILYLDCDMFVEGGDLNGLFQIDIGPHPIAAALDAYYFFRPNFHAEEYVKAGLPALAYANTGFQLIETRAYVEQEVERRSLDICNTHPHAIVLTDQSLTNLALRGKFAQLAPCWNWQLNGRYPLIPVRYPVFFRHFVSRKKPDRDSSGWFDTRFNHAYREFYATFFPEALEKLAPPCDPAPIPLVEASRIMLRHFRGMGLVKAMIDRHPDPYRARI
ncbi:glycosyltransferase family 8 protein [Tabrizicola soli]|uniref:Glycosyltransferase family 8 protein n=1 Tax=Tabrizicola soli TaxID=2185115 RepID=A0ABV7DTK7_9RHOB|nr:glycosyltransferase [Tabrizicola soli]